MAAHESLSPQQFGAKYQPFTRGEQDWTKTAYGHNDANKKQAYEYANGEAWDNENNVLLKDKPSSGGQAVFRPSQHPGSVN